MDKLLVIKIGGNVLDNEGKRTSFLKQFAAISHHKILIHGGGKLATDMAEKMQLEQQLVEGRRVTDTETLKLVTMVYAGWINKNIVAYLQSNGCNAIGLSGADGNLIKTHKRQKGAVDFGFVGDVDKVNSDLLHILLNKGLIPVIAPITHDLQGQLLNTNADTVAQEISKSMTGHYEVELIYLFEKAGVMLQPDDDTSVIRSMTHKSYTQLKTDQVITAGMIPKLDNAFEAIHHGVKKVMIGRSDDVESVLSGEKGTRIS